MGSTIIATQQREFQNVALTGMTSAFATGAGVSTASTTKPSAGIVYDASSNNELTSLIKFVPYLSTNDATGMEMRLIGWNGYVQTGGTTMWVPLVIGLYTLNWTSGTVPSMTLNGATMYLPNRIANTATNGIPTASVNLYGDFGASNASVFPIGGVVDMIGSQIVTVQLRASNATTGGILWAPI